MLFAAIEMFYQGSLGELAFITRSFSESNLKSDPMQVAGIPLLLGIHPGIHSLHGDHKVLGGRTLVFHNNVPDLADLGIQCRFDFSYYPFDTNTNLKVIVSPPLPPPRAFMLNRTEPLEF